VGVTFQIDSYRLPIPYRGLSLRPTTEGCSASVYYLGEDYILKIFEPGENIAVETTLYRHLHTLPVAHPLAYFSLEGRDALVFPKLSGRHPSTPSSMQLGTIGTFLQHLHRINTETVQLPVRYSHTLLYQKIVQCNDPLLLRCYHTLEAPKLQEKVLIHGDLFRDNALFEKEKLIGVIDWSGAALGDPLFDLAVVALDWCIDRESINHNLLSVLIHSYSPSLQKETLFPYIRYALLYYAATRCLAQGNYTVLLNKLERLHA